MAFNFKNIYSLKQGEQDPQKVKAAVISNISFRGSNFWILACAILIACIGLNVNSYAILIGAMLISPLMGPIVGAGFALATYDFDLLKRSAKNLIIATVVGFSVSALYFYLSPFKEVQSEILARTTPTIYDALIAFIGGIVGAISITRVEKGNPIPGVAIATALMPPLCTAGFGFATLNYQYFLGAFYLYIINAFFIAISTFAIIKYLKYKPVHTEDAKFDKKVRIIVYVLMIIMTVPSVYLAYNLLQEKKYEQYVEQFLNTEFYQKGYTIIYKKSNYKSNPKTLEIALLDKDYDSTEIAQLNADLANYKITNTLLTIKQNSSDIKSEILAEINLNNGLITEKDLQVTKLLADINSYKVGNAQLNKEVSILFPNITSVSFGKINNYSQTDSTTTSLLVLYTADTIIDESRLRSWLSVQLNDPNVRVVKDEIQPQAEMVH